MEIPERIWRLAHPLGLNARGGRGHPFDTTDAAVLAADSVGYPVALKLAAPTIGHKSEIGGVRLGLADASAVNAAFDAIMEGVPIGTAVDGVVVSPMRNPQVELIVSVSRDPVWGPVLAVGLGGIWVEVMADVALLTLPTDPQRIKRALLELKAAPLFLGARGRSAINLDVVAQAVAKIADAVVALGPDVSAVEINPLAIFPDHAEAMDALRI